VGEAGSHRHRPRPHRGQGGLSGPTPSSRCSNRQGLNRRHSIFLVCEGTPRHPATSTTIDSSGFVTHAADRHAAARRALLIQVARTRFKSLIGIGPRSRTPACRLLRTRRRQEPRHLDGPARPRDRHRPQPQSASPSGPPTLRRPGGRPFKRGGQTRTVYEPGGRRPGQPFSIANDKQKVTPEASLYRRHRGRP